MGGHVAKKLGDGLMALFGYPLAQENDAERAVRAALSIQRGLAELNSRNAGSGTPALAARIAIDCGPVVVDASGEIFGDVPNIAARAQALAEPGAVVVTARVQRQVAGLFVAEERGSHALKGVPEPVTLFRLIRASGGGRRAGQRHLTPLVGRDEEIAALHAALGAGAAGRWAIGADRRRARLRQVAPDRGISHPAARSAAHLDRMELLTASAKHAAAPDRRMGPPTLRRRRGPGRAPPCGPGKLVGTGQARPGGKYRAACSAARRSAAGRPRAGFAAGGIAAAATGGADQLDHGRARAFSRWYWRSKICIGPIRPRSMSCAASPSAARWRRCSQSRRRGPSFGRLGACARITARFRSRRSIAIRCGKWSASWRHATPCRTMSLTA